MSRAFVKESDDDRVAGDLPERPVPAHANYVTPRGMELLQSRVRELTERHEKLKREAELQDNSAARQTLRETDRDLRYFHAQLERAVLVQPAEQSPDEIHFGATVEIEEENGARHEFSIVGDDEADVASGKISWASPLARAMIGAKCGDTVTWHRPAGEVEVYIVGIRYPV